MEKRARPAAADEDPVEQVMASMAPSSRAQDGDQTAPHVFLSHAGEQKMSVVDVVRDQIKRKYPQLDVFVDEWSLKGGDRPMERIGAACWGTVVGVVLLSKEFVRKKYCMAELRILLLRWRVTQGQQSPQQHEAAAAAIAGGLAGLVLGSEGQGSGQAPVWLLPVLFELTVQQLRGMRALYDSEPWCVDEPKPSPAVLDAWAADLQAVAEFTLIRPDQWRGYSGLAEMIEERAVELLDAAGKLPPPPGLLMGLRSTVTPPEEMELVGREEELGAALGALKAGRYVELCGGPGEGKTTLMQRLVAAVCGEWTQQPAPQAGGKVAYALEVDLALEGLQVLGLRDGKDLKNVVAAKLLAQVQQTADKEQWQVLQGWLQRQAPAPVLIALENAEECVAALKDKVASVGRVFQEVLQQLSRHGHVHLIVATRARTPFSKELPAGSVVMLQQLTESQGLQLLENRVGKGPLEGAEGAAKEAAKQLVQLVQCNPLTLAVAAGLVRKGRSWEDVLRCAQQNVAEVNAKSRLDPTGMKHYMATLRAWLEAFLEEPEQQLLASTCVFPGSFTGRAAAAVSTAGAIAASDVDATLQLLVDMSLLRCRDVIGVSTEQPDLCVKRYSMHALVRSAAACSRAGLSEEQAISQRMARWMLGDNEGPGQALLRCKPAGPQPDQALLQYLLREELQNFAAAGAGLLAGAGDVALVGAAGDVGWQLSDVGHGLAARQLQQCAVQLAEELLGPEHLDTLKAKYMLGVTLVRMGELGGARTLQEEVLEARMRVLGPEHQDTLTSKTGLAITLGRMGELAEGRRLEEEVLEARIRLLGPEDPDILRAKVNLACTLRGMGERMEARRLDEEVLEASARVLGPEHLDTLRMKANMATSRRGMGELGEAKRLDEEVLEALTRVLGPEHPDTLRAKVNMGITLEKLGELAEARRLEEEVLVVHTRKLGPDHPDTLTIKGHLADVLTSMGALEEARRLGEELLEASARVLGLAHPTTLTAKDNLAITMKRMGRIQEARQLQEEALQASTNVLGPEHPDTLTTKGNLANTLKSMGEFKEARRLEVEVLEASIEVLGAEHPDTLATKANLANTCKHMGELVEARRLEEEVLEASTRTLGPAHPLTMTIKGNLAITLKSMGELVEARRLEEEVLVARTQADFGLLHHHTLAAKGKLINMLWSMGELGEARRLQEELLEALTRELGPGHPNTAMAQGILGVIMRDIGEVGQARRLHEEALAVLTQVWGSDNPSTLAAKQELGWTLHACAEPGEARRLAEEVLEASTRMLGPPHPSTLAAKCQLAIMLWRIGQDLGKARRLLVDEVLEASTRVLGPKHPITANAKGTLGVILRDMGEVGKDSRLLQEEALAVMEMMYGPKYPGVLFCKHELGVTLQACGEPGEAKRLWEEVLQARVQVLGAEHPDTLKTRGALAGLVQAGVQ